jgi:hypothetical protein
MRAVPKILIITGDAAESLEVMYPYQRLLEEGYQVDIAAPSVKKLQFVVHDFVDGFDTYTEKLGYTWPSDVAFADVNPADYVALVIPGGRAPEYIRNDPHVHRPPLHERGPARRPAVPRRPGAGHRRDAQRPPYRRLPGARPGRGTGGRGVRRRGGRRGRADGLGARLARPPGVDARVHPYPAVQGSRLTGRARLIALREVG